MSTCSPSFFRDLFIGLTCVSLIIAPFGCTITTGPIDDGGGGTTTGPKTGLFLNGDQTSPILMAGLGESGDSYFVYGTRDNAGNAKEIQAIALRQADGKEAGITFDGGRPAKVTGPDGSSITISYTSVTIEKLAGSVTLFNAADGTHSQYSFEVNPLETADQVAAIVKEKTGIDLPVPSAAILASAATEKSAGRSLTVEFMVLPLFATLGSLVIVMGQIFAVMLAVVAVIMHPVILAIFLPLILLVELFNETGVHIQIEPLFPIFGNPPKNPHDSGL